MRYDSFIIWGNGLQYIKKIINVIRDDNNFEIIFMKYYNINEDMLSFIKKIYVMDSQSWTHLELKTKYLIESEKKIYFILVRNYKPDEIIKGKGLESQKIIDMKIKLRNLFNPRSTDKRELGFPLNDGVSHRHIIHGTDHENHVNHLLETLNFKKLDYYKRHDNSKFYIPYHLDISKYNIIEININQLKVDIIGKGLLEIDQTPYYKYLNNNKQEYIDYYNTYSGNILEEDHSPEKFEKLYNNFELNYINKMNQKCYIIVKKEDDYYRILDGGHRASILKFKNINKIGVLEII